jgi:hypothetical protein
VTGRRLLAGLGATLATLAAAAVPAAAERSQGVDMHDARYCEILELKGSIPDAKVLVWNTLGLNDCPAGWWESLDAGQIAAEEGDAIVVLNGPRHFLMDSAKARTGKVRSFHGERLRRVATLPVDEISDLDQSPYHERTVNRVNTWHWKAGRRIFELRAPNGYDYVMQSYSQIVDPGLKLADLRSLGSRLDLPQGWSYRVKRLERPLTLRAKGSATILQDELKNTYQRLPRTDDSRRHRVDMSAVTRSVGSPSSGTIEDQGTVAGTPFGAGTIDLFATFQPGARMTGTFTIDAKRGSAFGTMDTTYVITGNEIDFTGTADFTGGTGAYRGITGTDLEVHDHNTLDGQNGTVTLEGFARY